MNNHGLVCSAESVALFNSQYRDHTGLDRTSPGIVNISCQHTTPACISSSRIRCIPVSHFYINYSTFIIMNYIWITQLNGFRNMHTQIMFCRINRRACLTLNFTRHIEIYQCGIRFGCRILCDICAVRYLKFQNCALLIFGLRNPDV